MIFCEQTSLNAMAKLITKRYRKLLRSYSHIFCGRCNPALHKVYICRYQAAHPKSKTYRTSVFAELNLPILHTAIEASSMQKSMCKSALVISSACPTSAASLAQSTLRELLFYEFKKWNAAARTAFHAGQSINPVCGFANSESTQRPACHR